MKILLLTPFLERPGGIQRYTATLTRALRDLIGIQSVHCLAITEDPIGQGSPSLSATAKWRLGWRAVREALSWRPDLIVCAHLAFGPIGWLLASLSRRKYFVIVYGIEAWVELPWWKRGPLRHADRIIVISAFSGEQVVKRHRIDDSRIVTLPCTVDETLLLVEPVSTGACARICHDQRVVLTVARMAAAERYKGHDEVLRALPSVVAKIPNLAYIIVGGGDDRSRLEDLTQELGLVRNVVFTGEVTDSELAALYHRSEVFLLPAKTVIDRYNPQGEGFGIVYLEAMAFKKPVIGPNYGAPADIIQHGQQGLLVDPADSAAIAEALLDLLNNPTKGREMGQAGSEWVRQHYSYGSFRERLQAILTTTATQVL